MLHFIIFAASFPPVVFIPGDGGNMVEAHVDIKSKANAECPTHRDWYRVWLNLKVSPFFELEINHRKYVIMIFNLTNVFSCLFTVKHIEQIIAATAGD